MKLCRYDDDRLGVVEGDAVHDVSFALTAIPTRRWPAAREDPYIAHLSEIVSAIARQGIGKSVARLSDVTLRCPVPNAPKIVGAPVNYQLHFDEARVDPGINFARPGVTIGEAGMFLKNPTSLIGPDEPIRPRFPDRRTDHEVELAVVIGTTCRNVPRAEALQHVAGYAIGLDITVRGKEDRSFRKSIDTYSVLGPWLTTADEIPDPGVLDLEIRCNGVVRQHSNTSRLIFDVPKLIEWTSSWYTLVPGDILMTGTPEGVGPIEPGDVLTCSIQRIGEMTVHVGMYES